MTHVNVSKSWPYWVLTIDLDIMNLMDYCFECARIGNARLYFLCHQVYRMLVWHVISTCISTNKLYIGCLFELTTYTPYIYIYTHLNHPPKKCVRMC